MDLVRGSVIKYLGTRYYIHARSIMPYQMKPSEHHLSLTRITDEQHFHALKAEWNRLCAESPSNSVFLRHEWFDAAWQWAGREHRLNLLCVYRSGLLIGICPLMLRVIRGPFVTRRKLTFLTVPDTQLCDVLSSPADLDAVIQTVAEQLFALRNDWDVLELNYLPAGSPTPGLLAGQMAKMGLRVTLQPAGRNPLITLQDGWDAFYSSRSRRLKKGNNLIANHLNKAGAPVVRQFTNKPDVATLLAAITEISARSWKTTTGMSLEHSGPRSFITCLSRHAAEHGWLSAWLLNLNDKPVAMEYQLIYQGSVHALRSDFDEAYGHLSPGTYLNWKQLEQLFGMGLATYYMGPGDNAYKYRWTETGEPLCRFRAYSSTLRGRCGYLLEERARPAAARIRSWINGLLHGAAKANSA